MSTNEPDLSQLTADQIRELIEKAGKPTDTPPPATELEVKTATGQIYRGKTQEELQAQLVKAQENATAKIAEQARLLAERERELAELRRGARPATPSPAANGNGYDHNRFLAMLAEDGQAAFDYIDTYRYGIENPRAAVLSAVETSLVTREAWAIQEFRERNPDFPASSEASELMIDRLNRMGYSQADADTLEIAYRALVREGRLLPSTPETPASMQPQSRGANAPPAVSSGAPSGDPGNLEDLAHTMPLEKLQELLMKMQPR